MADEKLPAKKDTLSLPEAPSGGSIFGRIKSAFRSRLNTRTIHDNRIEAEAYRRYLEEMERLPEAMLKKDRAVAHYVHHRDDIIENDHQQHLRQMNKEQIQREIDAEEDLHKLETARLRRKEQLLKTKTKEERAQFVLDTFTATAPHRKDSEESKYRKGAANEALDMIAVLQTFLEDEKTDDASVSPRVRTLEDDLAFIEGFIKNVQNTATPEQLYILYTKRGQLSAQIEEEKDRPS